MGKPNILERLAAGEVIIGDGSYAVTLEKSVLTFLELIHKYFREFVKLALSR